MYRTLYPKTEDFTWRGTMTGTHGGRGLRIDHCIVSKKLAERVSEVNIIGCGTKRNGFMGCDHSPLLIKLETEKEGLRLK